MFHSRSIALAIVFAACGGGTQSTPPPATASSTDPATPGPELAPVPAHDIVQPTEVETVDSDRDVGHTADGDAEPHPVEEAPPPPPPPPPGPPKMVPSRALELQRISGETNILPDAATLATMQKSGKARVIASFKLCLDAGGDVSDVKLLKSSGFASYDATIASTMHQWHYRPFMINGKGHSVCTAVTFVYPIPAATPAQP